MAWYEDLTPLDYFNTADDRLLAIGWLGRDHPFNTGPTPPAVFHKLCELAVKPWQPLQAFGWHDCELCQFHVGPRNCAYQGVEVALGVSNVFLPAKTHVLVAPSLVIHYIDAHFYRPPDRFFRAISDCPPMGSQEYRRQLLEAGGRDLLDTCRYAAEPSR